MTPVHHEILGDPGAPPLLLASSLGTTAAMWDPQVAELAARFRVIRYDHRGHGGSPVPAGPYTIADLGADVLALLDHLGIGRAHFAGLSLGGMTGMWLAAHAPERIDRLALLCTSARLGPPSVWTDRVEAVLRDGTGSIAEAVVGRWFTPGFAERRPDVVAAHVDMLRRTPAAGYAACCLAIRDMDLTGDLPAITAPTLVLAAADDPSTPPEPHARTIAAGIPGARLVTLADAAHLANVEQPGPVTAHLIDHLDHAGS
ncbi:3-oxoadipate enol-lactonase [Microtetraspora sp. NBRC 13810]|uniref:3-oxoadipate enol-lactonase n=1 Tax=Microtetraspora sp. NBRC 13810 TaxID=3030990 RepID=UPI0024A1C06D|nr:3-oxoadipate enol-lactonase [Microtetraspora sp. NBRC 13810]GLW06034.1 3-oxoadipate enol-lactonase [Microtetraspora sp. NBRC 13810]